MKSRTERSSTRRPAAGLSVVVAALLAYQSTQLDSVWRYPLGVLAIILVIVAIRAMRRAGQ